MSLFFTYLLTYLFIYLFIYLFTIHTFNELFINFSHLTFIFGLFILSIQKNSVF